MTEPAHPLSTIAAQGIVTDRYLLIAPVYDLFDEQSEERQPGRVSAQPKLGK